MKLQDITGLLGRAAKRVANPKTVAILGAAVALLQLVMALDELRDAVSDRDDSEEDSD